MEHRIEKLRQTGNIALWRYSINTKNYPGWHFTADEAGRAFLYELFELMANSEWPSHKMLDTTSPNKLIKVPNLYTKNNTWQESRYMLLRYNLSENDCLWSIKLEKQNVVIEFGESKLKEFQKSLMRMEKNENDFVMVDTENSVQHTLWFW